MFERRTQIGFINTKDGNELFRLYRGLDAYDQELLVRHTQVDPVVSQFTGDVQRFKDMNAVEEWLKKDRYIYTLGDPKSVLAGIIWFREAPMPEREYKKGFSAFHHRITFAIRMYEQSRDRGLALPFMASAFADFMCSEDYQMMYDKNFWLEVSADNAAAVALYHKYGFNIVDEPDEQNKMHMALTLQGL